MRIILSTSASARLQAALAFLDTLPRSSEIVIVGASRGAVDDLARVVARRAGATFGLTRFSLVQLAARAAASRMAEADRTPGTQAGAEAIAARAVFDAVAAGELAYFSPVAKMPGFPKALARTLYELRLAGISSEHVRTAGVAGADVGRLLARVEAQLALASVEDRASLFRLAAEACRAGQFRLAGLPLLLLDVPLDSRSERDFVAALAVHAPQMLATVPHGDQSALDGLVALSREVAAGADRSVRSKVRPRSAEDSSLEVLPDTAPGNSDLANLRRYVFTVDRPAVRGRSGDVRLFSAPGEGREAVEIVRRVLDEAARGVLFDEMAVLLRSPEQYLGLLEHACARGGVPVYLDRGTRRPDPSGRAFIALLSCAVDGLSAKRFDEYLSLGQVPQIGEPPAVRAIAPQDDVMSAFLTPSEEPVDVDWLLSGPSDEPNMGRGPDEARSTAEAIDSDDETVIAGTLRSPWRWEELIVESAVVGGRDRADGRRRWQRRLDGLAADYRYRLDELGRDEPESARVGRYQRDLRNLAHLRAFALPIVDELSQWPGRATWGEWLDRFTALAPRTLRRPTRVLETLADLRPMAEVGPIALEEARDVLHDRLVTLDWEPPARRYGRVFVGTPHQARGRSFKVVFVPGLAERVVPQRPREDPLLLDEARARLHAGLVDQEQRGSAERLLLKIAIGAASERLYLSYPRIDVAEARARVPSFYALDVMRAVTGLVPDHRVLASEAADEGGASLSWPAPRDPDRAIDDLEHDLAVLKPLLDTRDPARAKGRAHYMLGLNDALRRSVISRWARGRSPWSTSDGLIKVAPGTKAALAANRLVRRPYSPSALQRFASCPYQFLLATIHRLEPRDEPEPLMRMDPLTRGSLFHRVQAEFYRTLKADGELPIIEGRLPRAAQTLETVLDRVAADYAEQLAPAIDRVWRDEIDDLRRDLGIWVQKLAAGSDWHPEYFEFSFGLSDEGRDPRSLPDPVVVPGGFVLRGSVDLIEHRADLDVLRVTDHKTGKNRSTPDLIVGGGAALQPVLYSVAVEHALKKKVVSGRLFYCTTAGAFAEHEIAVNDYTRGQGLQVLTIIDRAVELGFLFAAPAERACTWCDFRPVCGPREEERIKRKAQDRLGDLEALRAMR